MNHYTLEYLRDCFITTALLDEDVYDGSIRRKVYIRDKPVEVIEKFRIDNQGGWPTGLTRDVAKMLGGTGDLEGIYLI